jgi:hypothetical protein
MSTKLNILLNLLYIIHKTARLLDKKKEPWVTSESAVPFMSLVP